MLCVWATFKAKPAAFATPAADRRDAMSEASTHSACPASMYTCPPAHSICMGDWADRLAALATASLAYTWTFPLADNPIEGSIVECP